MSRAASRSASNSGRASAAALRFSMKPLRTKPMAFCRFGSSSARLAFALKSREVACIVFLRNAGSGAVRLADRRLAKLAGQHLGHMARLDPAAASLELAGHVQQAAEVSRQQQVGAAFLDRL